MIKKLIHFFKFSTLVLLMSPVVSSAKERKSFELIFVDGVVKPQTLKVPAGEKFKIIVKNEGKTAEEFESIELNREKVIAPGKKTTVFLGPLKKGSYKFMGEFHMTMKSANGTIVAE